MLDEKMMEDDGDANNNWFSSWWNSDYEPLCTYSGCSSLPWLLAGWELTYNV